MCVFVLVTEARARVDNGHGSRVYPGHEQEENVASFVVRKYLTPGHQPSGPRDPRPAEKVSRLLYQLFTTTGAAAVTCLDYTVRVH